MSVARSYLTFLLKSIYKHIWLENNWVPIHFMWCIYLFTFTLLLPAAIKYYRYGHYIPPYMLYHCFGLPHDQ